jgi:lipoprotein-anchoring transpeptidase ErfK/SrfK
MFEPMAEIDINLKTQRLCLRDGDAILAEYPVSTARNGPGERMDSECTPRGRHVVDEKIGQGCTADAVFVGRRPTGEVYDRAVARADPRRDWIVTRILWLRGMEPGRNAGGDVDSKGRYIYIHGTPEDTDMTKPGSRGCIRMRNRHIIELFDRVEVGTPVHIHEG